MKQVVQPVGGGDLRVLEVPPPSYGPTQVLVAARRSLVSAGTERAVRRLASSGLLHKARSRPDLVRQVVERARAEGITSTVQAVRGRLDEEMPLGYSAAGVVCGVGEAVARLRPGDRVATASAGHAEYQVVPGLLAVPIPDGVSDQAAAFGAVAAIALQGLRQAGAEAGGAVCVVGLGLVGQLTARLAMAAGLDVVGADPRASAVELARSVGVLASSDDAETDAACVELTVGRGVDAVLVTAATRSSVPVMSATRRVRDRGRVVVVGDVGLELDRTPFYDKEIDLRFARSYGPGRYERSYEDWAVDYPVGHVRWTEGRNIEAYLRLLARGRLVVDDLVTHVFPVSEAAAAYDVLDSDPSAIGVQFRYDAPLHVSTAPEGLPRRRRRTTSPRLGLVGAGTFASVTLLPALQRIGWSDIVAVTSSSGLTARRLAERHGIARVCATADDLIASDDVDAVVVVSRHDSHASLTSAALRGGKHVFCEKPLALSEEELDEVRAALAAGSGVLWAGFNRRHSPLVAEALRVLGRGSGPIVATYRVNAGRLPESHWCRDRRQGGRLLGEVCHFVDTASWLVGEAPASVSAVAAGRQEALLQDDVVVALTYPDGSLATVSYATGGSSGTSKERLEVLGRGHSVLIDDFRRLEVDGRERRLRVTGKGHDENLRRFRAAVRGELDAGPDLAATLGTTRAMFSAVESLLTGRTVSPAAPNRGSRR